MNKLNFDWSKVRWVLAYDADPKYRSWGSPTCPEEPHSHRTTGRLRLSPHWVDYPSGVGGRLER